MSWAFKGDGGSGHEHMVMCGVQKSVNEDGIDHPRGNGKLAGYILDFLTRLKIVNK